MTAKEAIDELQYQEDMRGKNIDYQVSNLVIAMAVEAFEKQIPKKPTDTIYRKSDNLTIGSCRICGAIVNSCMDYCEKCGQALDWGEDDV